MDQLEAAEKGVVGACLIEPSSYELANLRREHFRDVRLQDAWAAIGELRSAGEPVDELTLPSRMRSGDQALLLISECALACPTHKNVTSYAKLIREAWLVRETQQRLSTLLDMATSGAHSQALISTLEKDLRSLQALIEAPTGTLYQTICERLEGVDDLRPGLPSGIGLERHVPGGLPRRKVTVLFGPEGTYKTTVKNAMMMAIAEFGERVLDVSIEDDAELTADRELSKATGVAYGRIAGGVIDDAERHQLKSFNPGELKHAENIILGDRIPPVMKDIVARAKYYKTHGGLAAVFVDYVQLLGMERQVIDDAMTTAQVVAKELDIAFVFLSQQKQDVFDRPNKRPMRTDPLGSSALRTACKLQVGLFKPSEHYPDPAREPSKFYRSTDANTYVSVIEAWVTKNVLGGPQKLVPLLVDGPTGRIEVYKPEQVY